MTTPTITLYPDTLPAKGQANAPFDVNVDNFLTWQTVTNGPELAAMITWTQGVADTVLATALAGNLPALTGEALNFIRANAAEDGGEFRTPAQVLSDIGATAALALKAPLASPAFTGVPTAPTATAGTDTTQVATTTFVGAAVAAAPVVGVGQTWQDVSASRSANTTYQNTTGRPIVVNLKTSASNSSIRVSSDNVTFVFAVGGGTGQKSAIVPDDFYYKLVNDNNNVGDWLELR